MRSPTIAILWEIWARHRWALVFAFGLLPMAAVFVALAEWWQPLRTFDAPSPALWVFVGLFTVLGVLMSLACLFWSFSFTALDERGRFAGFPLRLFTLPIRTRSAVAVPLFTGLLTIVLVYTAWFLFITRVLLAPRLPANEPLPGLMLLAWQVLVLGAGYVTLQALIWLLYPARHLRIVLLSILPLGFWWLWMFVPEAQFHEHPARWFSGMAALLVAAVFSAFKVVEWDRRGGWEGARRWFAGTKPRSTAARFASSARAQFWFEWQRKGWFGGVLFGVVMGLSLFLWPVPRFIEGELNFAAAGFPPRPIELLVFGTFPMFALVVTATLAAGFGKADLWLPDIALPSFHATRPLTSAALVLAKMRAGALVVLLGWGVFFLFVGWIFLRSQWKPEANAFWLSFELTHPALWKWLTHPLVLVTLVAVQWHSFVGGMCAPLAGRSGPILVTTWRNVTVLSAVLGVALWCYHHPEDLEFWLILLPSLAVALAIWKVMRAGIFFGRALPLLSRGEVRAFIAIWFGLCALIAGAAFFAQQLSALPPEIIWFCAAWFMPAGEMPACVLNLAANRHR